MTPRSLVFSLALFACTPELHVGTPVDATPAVPKFLRVHLDQAKPGMLSRILATRAEYKGWVDTFGTPPGEVPVAFVRLGEDRLWAMRPSNAWESMPADGAREGEVEKKVHAGVGDAAERNESETHASILEHHNEIFRFQAELSRVEGTLSDVLAKLEWVAVDHVAPDGTVAYEAKLTEMRAARHGAHLVYFSSPGAGTYVHFSAGPLSLPDASLTTSRTTFEARSLPDLGRPAH